MTTLRSPRVLSTLVLVLATSLLLLSSGTAAAAPPIAKDGKIHACYKAKGKGKGTLRVFPGAQKKCPKKWRKVSWHVRGPAGLPGTPGPPGPRGDAGLPGQVGNVDVTVLEAKVSELLTKVQGLEAILAGVTRQDLLDAIALSPVVQVLCTQAGTVTGRLNVLEGVLGGLNLNGVLTTLGGLLNIPVLPGPLPAFSCPTAP